jgi:hypothetical protein
MAWAEVCARRLDRHALAAPLRQASPAEAVAAMCGAHAQMLSAAELSIGLRIAGITRAHIQAALWADHSLIKTFGPRGTVHLLPAHDLAMWAGALSAIPPTPSPFAPDVRLSPEQTEAIIAAMANALADAELTIDELNDAIIAEAGAWAGDLVMPAFQVLWPRWRQAVDTAANHGVLCFGPNRGRKVTYTSPRRWLPEFRPAESHAASIDVVRRYLYAYGPATSAQFAQWFGAPRRWANDLFDSLADELVQVDLDGAPAWRLAGDTGPSATTGLNVRLLPYFDSYVVGSHPRSLLFPGRAAVRALSPSGQAGNFPVLLIDGIVAGVWHQRRSGRKLLFTVEPFDQLTAAQRRGLDEQVEQIATFLEGTPQLTIGTVTVGPHA